MRERKKGEEGDERERAKEEKKEKEVEVGREKNHRTSKCLLDYPDTLRIGIETSGA